MLTLHTCPLHDTPSAPAGDDALAANVVWVDLFNPTRDEELRMEAALGVLLPTREDMAEIETSSRLYIENHAAFMTAQVAFYGGQKNLQSEPVTFVLAGGRLVTIRYIEPASFKILKGQIEKQPVLCSDGPTTFLNLIDVVIDRTADMIEKTAKGIEELQKSIFTTRRKTPLESVIISLGEAQQDNARIRDSLVSLARLTAFASGLEVAEAGIRPAEMRDFRERLKTMAQDVASLSDHASYVSGNIAFLLDAALGLINVEQNTIVKIISITSVIFLPLTLIASIYGMNFDYMPYLHSPEAFWGICGVMVVIIAVLLVLFKWQR
ncbi:MAG: magnesium transporter CorA family protein [Asticcacaulis sp.]|nr:magnesium transporter CorA family protein [Asticcacaulis sp.]